MIYLVLNREGDDYGAITKFITQILDHLAENGIKPNIGHVSDLLDMKTELVNGTVTDHSCLTMLETFTFQTQKEYNDFKEGFEAASLHGLDHYTAYEMTEHDEVDMREIQHTVSFIGTEEQLANLDFALGHSDNDLPRRLETTHTDQSLFLLTAIAGNGMELIIAEYNHYIDAEGCMPMYEMLLNISDKLLLGDDSEYQKFLKAENKDDWFHRNHDTCMDWYFIEEAKKIIREELKDSKTEPIEEEVEQPQPDSYNLFLTLELGRNFGVITTDQEYDNLWADALILFEEFEASPYNNEDKGMYDCISNFCQEYEQNRNTKKKDEVERILINMWARLPIDTPNNYEDIVQYCFEDVCDTAEKDNWNDGDVMTAFRRWIEGENRED